MILRTSFGLLHKTRQSTDTVKPNCFEIDGGLGRVFRWVESY